MRSLWESREVRQKISEVSWNLIKLFTPLIWYEAIWQCMASARDRMFQFAYDNLPTYIYPYGVAAGTFKYAVATSKLNDALSTYGFLQTLHNYCTYCTGTWVVCVCVCVFWQHSLLYCTLTAHIEQVQKQHQRIPYRHRIDANRPANKTLFCNVIII